ncbi:TM0106 family RecB-like putative nuclease [Glaciihabitans arcticus]|uniref:TM0106 family RecB-like putative nuclease n=1 Tax=Glaciihabitans arcticus TaxID=2668039 RepID=A0A4Q9GWL8_9MICO|nr:bifunctional RecB family nuclease/DEAD/DEAH box helicase [Glaciihabitans arcticus]TBN56630.1 TM0106 family RecB-like putative nuclease [Glaciihabitans arcticus]
MFLLDRDDPTSTVVYSASDLSAAASCEWGLMRRLDDKLGRITAEPQPEDDMLVRAGLLGTIHERETLERLRDTRRVVEFAPTFESRDADAAASLAALKDGADVLFQATFFDGRLLGYADFIMQNTAGEYEVYDTKLARKAKITALLQLAAYSDQLVRLGIPIGPDVHLILGDGTTSTHAIRDVLPVFRKRRARLQRILDEKQADPVPTPWGDPRYTACGRCAQCAAQVELHRDVLLVSGIQLTQRHRLAAAGIHTIDELAQAPSVVDGIAASTLAGLRAQARVQLRTTGEVPAFEVFAPETLSALPHPDAGDIFFDFEGDPLYSENAVDGKEWGLDYLFGLVEADATFRTFWAHDYVQERDALIAFLAYVAERRARFPNLHIYHYAAYERTHLLSLSARHGVGEEQVDDLLRQGVLVDLYPAVKKAIRIGSHSYSIKKLEPLYMPTHRSGVDNAADSVQQYADARVLIESGSVEEGQAKLDAIASYNEYDCVSTLRLRDWLLEQARALGVEPTPARELELELPVARDPSPVYVELAAHVADVPLADRTADDTAIALASATIDYHRREAKKFWQDHFDRLQRPIDEWADVRDVLAIDRVEVLADWSLTGRQTKARRTLLVSGRLAPGSSLKEGSKPFLVYNDPAPLISLTRNPGSKASSDGEVLEVTDDGWVVLELLEAGAERHDAVPAALSPGKPPPARPQPEAIESWGQRVLRAIPQMLPDAALDILRKAPPRGGIVPVTGTTIEAIRDTLLGLDHSYLAVQGPPGTGKTYTGARVIRNLVENHGWKVGIVAQSHETVKNMLFGIVAAGLDPKLIGKKAKDGDTDIVPWQSISTPASFVNRDDGWVLGGTAWTFANAGAIPPGTLDLLVVDEAGQFSLASTIASAGSAKRLLLLGDPQQLPQVSQGSHPEPVDVSALGWLSEGHDVLPPEFGYFLERSWRMHPAVCEPVSRLSYDGKLRSQAGERLLAGVDPGLHPLPVAHEQNATSSPEEATRALGLVRDLLGTPWTVAGETRPLDQRDIIVVAPYNAQVELLRSVLSSAGFDEVPVGTVDKFQGKEAAIAIVSLAASSAAEVPRGLEFLLLANRLNVAISRAQWAAYLLYSPALLDYLPSNAATLAQLSAFIELVEGESVSS